MKSFIKLSIFIAAIAVAATRVNAQHAPSPAAESDARLWNLYKSAVINSAYTDSSKIWNGLISINDTSHSLRDTMIGNERYVLVVTWKGSNYYAQTNTPYAQPISSQGYDMWVTIAPELKNKVKGTKPANLDLRLEQLLGLPPVKKYYNLFFEFWVRPQDLYRPCPDNEITDNACQLAFPANVAPEYRAWADSQRISRFFGGEPTQRYPWTELGYTYDWSPLNPSHHGCSEFVIKRWATIYQRYFYTTSEYIYGK